MPDARVPVVLLTGWLGAGKTTLLNHLLAVGLGGRRVAVVVNDIGAIGVDGRLVADGATRVAEIASGCVCCSAGDEFAATLEAVLREVRPEAIVVETSGVANPMALLTVLEDDRLRLDTVAAVVDTSTFAAYRHYASVIELQVMFADLVIFNKADLVPPALMAEAEAAVRAVNDRAVCLPAVRGTIDPTLLLGTLPTDYRADLPRFIADERARALARHPEWAAPAAPPLPGRAVPAHRALPVLPAAVAEADHADAATHHHHGHHHGHHHDHADPLHGYHLERDGIATVEWQGERPLRQADLEEALTALAGHGVYRAKGIVTVAEGPPHRLVVNLVAGRYELEARPDAPGPSQLVCIGKAAELDRLAILGGWEACVVAPGAAS